MTTTITTKLAGHEVIASCLSGDTRPFSAAVSGAPAVRTESLAILLIRERAGARPIQAPAVAAAAQADAYAFACAANGAGEGQKQTQHHSMWAFRGLEPWRDPA